MHSEDYYSILGISRDATQETVKAAYRQLVLKYHPDRNQGNEAYIDKFSKIRKAYETLSDERKRKDYDAHGLKNITKLFSTHVTHHSSKIILSVSKRVTLPDDFIHVSIHVFEAGSHFQLRGISKFEVVEGPVIRSFKTQKSGSPLLEMNYILRPKEPGYLEVGPASFISNGVKYMSESIHIKVNVPAGEIKLRPFSPQEKILSAVAGIMIIFFLTLTAYNLYKYNLSPRFAGHSPMNYASEPTPVSHSMNDVQLPTGISPYDRFFGPGIYDPESFNEIRFVNGQLHDAVVCLADINTHKTIRNSYIRAGQRFSMSQIPDGVYYLKAIFGNDWSSEKKLADEDVIGNFKRNVRYEIFHQEIHLNQQSERGDTLSFKVYEITLYPVHDGNTKSVITDESDFFE